MSAVFNTIFSYTISFTVVLMLFNMSMLLIGRDIFSLRDFLQKKHSKNNSCYKPLISIIIPAYNEEKVITRCIISILRNTYPKERTEIIVINDGSSDNTEHVVRKFKKKHRVQNLFIASTKNIGKGNAITFACKNFVRGELVMTLDADSYLSKDAISNTVKYFRDEKVIGTAANIKIFDSSSILGILQKIEYLIGHQAKKAVMIYNMDYLIGGVGSTFRKELIESVGYYDGDTLTEDLDLTLKLIKKYGNRDYHTIFASDVIAYTEHVMTIRELISQRLRWRYGHFQMLLKNRSMLFNRSKKYSKTLTFLRLPNIIFVNFNTLFLFPIVFLYSLSMIFYYKNFFALLTAYLIVTFYVSLNILGDEHTNRSEKILLLSIAPIMYLLNYVLIFIEYIVVVKGIFNLRNLRRSIKREKSKWSHVKRSGMQVLSQ